MNKVVSFEYNRHRIDFDMTGENIMVNATAMAKAFEKRIDFFLKSQDTEAFIQTLLFPPNGGNKTFLKREELIATKGKKGTFMHRLLALKFAAWLDPGFEVWVYTTIDHLLFGRYREMEDQLKKRAWRMNQIAELETRLKMIPDFQRLKELETEERQSRQRMASQTRTQLELFRAQA
jgi:hypothetical protein